MEEIKVNDYVRTKDGFIYKIEDGEEFYEDSVDVGIGIMPAVDGIWVDKEHIEYIEKDNIKSHSPNIIDLIEENDYVNGYKVIEKAKSNIRENGIMILVYRSRNCEHWETIFENEIESIVTHESFNSIKYEVE